MFKIKELWQSKHVQSGPVKRPLWASVVGLLSIIIGILVIIIIIYRCLKFAAIMKAQEDLGAPVLYAKYIFAAIFGIYNLIAGILLLKLKSKALNYYIGIGYFILIIVISSILNLGGFSNFFFVLLGGLIGLLIIWFFNRKQIKAQFRLDQKVLKEVKWGNKFALLMLLVLTIAYLIFRFVDCNSQKIVVSQVEWDTNIVTNASAYKPQKAFNYEFELPSDFKLRPKNGPDNEITSIWYSSKAEKIYVNINKNNFFKRILFGRPGISEWKPVANVKDEFYFAKQLINERVGLIPLIIRSTNTSRVFYEINSTEWQGYIEPRWSGCYTAALWNKQKPVSIEITVLGSDKNRTKMVLNNVINSLRVVLAYQN